MSPALPCSRWLLAVALFTFGATLPLASCPFCSRDGTTLSNEVLGADFVVFGRLGQARVSTNADGTENASTELFIEEVLKPHDFLKGKKMIVLPRYMPVLDNKQPDKCLIFCYCHEGRVSPYLLFAVRDRQFVDYLKGVLGPKQVDRAARARFFFDHLDSENLEIANDAYREFAQINYKDVQEMVAKHGGMVRQKLLHWMQERERHVPRLALIGMMLGLCGKPEDAALLRDALNDPQIVTGLDGLMAGYILANRTDGWAYLTETLRDRGKNSFSRRHAALRTVKFFLRDHPGHVPEKDIWATYKLMLDDPDLADLALPELRHAKHWSHLDQVLVLDQQESHQTFSIQRAILQYMLRCPDEKAKQYVAKVRQYAPQRLKNAEDDLLYDSPPPQ